jgi:hypothetical protein
LGTLSEGGAVMARIDNYYEDIAQAIKCGDNKRVSEIAQYFYDRVSWGARSFVVEDVQVSNISLHIKIKAMIDGDEVPLEIVFPINRKGSIVKVTGHLPCGQFIEVSSMDRCVDFLGVPFAFLQGMQTLAACICSQIEQNKEELLGMFKKRTEDRFEWLLKRRDILHDEIISLEQLKLTTENQLKKLLDDVKSISADNPPVIQPPNIQAVNRELEKWGVAPILGACSVSEVRKKYVGKSGIYFAWRMTDGEINYVGRSSNISQRVSNGRDELRNCQMTVLEMPDELTHHWECYFIWLLRPACNTETRRAIKSIKAEDAA